MSCLFFVSHTSEMGGPNFRLVNLLKLIIHHNYEIIVTAPGSGQLFEILREMPVQLLNTGDHNLTSRAIPWLYKNISRYRVDLVYGNNFSSGTRNALIAAKLARIPYVWHINEMLEPRFSHQYRLTFFLKYSDALITDSKACQESVLLHVPNKIVHQINNGIDYDRYHFDRVSAKKYLAQTFGIPTSNIVISSAGTICSRKGQLHAVEAAIQILQNTKNVVFLFLGDTNYEEDYTNILIQLIAKANLSDKILFPGFREDLSEILIGSDIFIHTAIKDPQPISVLAAMAARLPVVAFSVDGVVEEVINGETGYLVEVNNKISLLKALKNYINDPDLRTLHGLAGRTRVEKFFSSYDTSLNILSVIEETLMHN